MAAGAPDSQIIDRLFSVVAARRNGDPEASYTAKLFSEGRNRIAQKLGEEAVETVIAAIADDRPGVAAESADLLYHLLVLWADTGVDPADIWAELARREGVSGLSEKASRGKTKEPS